MNFRANNKFRWGFSFIVPISRAERLHNISLFRAGVDTGAYRTFIERRIACNIKAAKNTEDYIPEECFIELYNSLKKLDCHLATINYLYSNLRLPY